MEVGKPHGGDSQSVDNIVDVRQLIILPGYV